MGFNNLLSATSISSSGLAAERLRMEVIANNIANAYSTRTPEGGPFRRQDVVFAAVLKDQVRGGAGNPKLGGVQVAGVVDDPSDFIQVYNPGHPDANEDGYVSMPNVQLPNEMVNLITASRAYEANLRVLQFFRQMTEQALTLGRVESWQWKGSAHSLGCPPE
jgi:flagellar basal-body rod protein FlgC